MKAHSVFDFVKSNETGLKTETIISHSACGLSLAGPAQLVGPPPTCHMNGEGRDLVYFMSASLEKLVFLVNSSNPVRCHMGVWEWRYSIMSSGLIAAQ